MLPENVKWEAVFQSIVDTWRSEEHTSELQSHA